MKIIDIIGYAGTAIGFIIAIISFISAKVKGGNIDAVKSQLENTKNILELIEELIPKAIKVAEDNGGSPVIKKLTALSWLVIECSKNNIDYNIYADRIDDALEKQIKFTKEVNAVSVKKEV